MPAGRPDHGHEEAIGRWRVERFTLTADDEGRRAGKPILSQRERHNGIRRCDRAAAKAAATPEGRHALAEAAAQVEAGRQAARMFARAGIDFRPAIADGFAAGALRIHELGLASHTARAKAILAALLRTVGMHLLGSAVEEGPRVMAGTKATTSKEGVRAQIAIGGFRDLANVAQGFIKLSAVLDETAVREESLYREEEKRRSIEAARSQWSARPALVHRENESEPDDDEHTGTEVPSSDEPKDVIEVSNSHCRLDPEEHGATDSGPGRPESVADDLDDRETGTVPTMVWCSRRARMCPPAIAGTPPPGPAVGPGWVAMRDRELRELEEFDRAVEAARRGAALKGFRGFGSRG